MIEAALDAGTVPEAVFVAHDASTDARVAHCLERVYEVGASVHYLASGVLERVSDTVTPQPIIGIVPFNGSALADLAVRGGAGAPCESSSPDQSTHSGMHKDKSLGAESLPGSEASLDCPPSLLIVCIDVRDPGNAGTVLRSAAGAGAAGVVFSDSSVDPYNPKTVRASAGSIFQVKFVAGGEPASIMDFLSGCGYRLIGTSSHSGIDYSRADLMGRVAIVLGNEAGGLPDSVLGLLDQTVTIPLASGVESLNVGIAGAIICFEAVRQARWGRLQASIAGAA
ncbi:MAG TPA: RNA methyltransferase [Acidimicrobiales bacterium]|nr:RNA methyltransferase [Acidimicrobiales bacterium]